MSVGFSDVFPREVVAWQDKELVVTPPSYATQAAYRTHLEREVAKGIDRCKAFVSASFYREQTAAFNHAIAKKTYAWGMPECDASLVAVENLKVLFELLVKQPSPDGARPAIASESLDMDVIWNDLAYAEPAEDGSGNVIRNKLIDAWDKVVLPLAKGPAPETGAASDSTSTK